MTITFLGVDLRKVTEETFHCEVIGKLLKLSINKENGTVLSFYSESNELVYSLKITRPAECHHCFEKSVILYLHKNNVMEKSSCSYVLSFPQVKDSEAFLDFVGKVLPSKKGTNFNRNASTFDSRTDSWSAVQYFQFYSYLSQQQNMMQDYIRTSTYERAILSNARADFAGKVVLDVGAGSGILSFFAIQAGAKRVYAVEASSVAAHCNMLVQSNKLAGRIVVVSGRIEEITLPEPVDVIISEPMGYMLYNERMLESYVHARKFLAARHRRSVPTNRSTISAPNLLPNGFNEGEAMQEDGKCSSPAEDGEMLAAEQKPGVMFPSVAHLYVVPFSDEALFAEQHTKANFWHQQSFHGMDLSALRSAAIAEYFNQPVVDTFDVGMCLAAPCVHKVDFRTVKESELATIDIPLRFQINQCSTVHGLAFWFDVGFLGSQKDVWLSTAPTEPLTHWYQVRCLLGTALFVQEGQILTGSVQMRANTRQSYDVEMELVVPGTDTKISNKLDLKNPHFRYTGYQPSPPPGSHTRPPTETYYANLQSNFVIEQQQSAPQAGLITTTSTHLTNQFENFQQYSGSLFISQEDSNPSSVLASKIPASPDQLITDSLSLLRTNRVSVPPCAKLAASPNLLFSSALTPGDSLQSGYEMSHSATAMCKNGWSAGQSVPSNSVGLSQANHQYFLPSNLNRVYERSQTMEQKTTGLAHSSG